MISVEEAQSRVLAAFESLPAETVPLPEALGRVTAELVAARLTQPPWRVAAMDGWAVRSSDVATAPATLIRVGEAPAGGAYAGAVGPGEAVRIFTGAPFPDGADTLVIQEDTGVEGNQVTVNVTYGPDRNIRPEGGDFTYGKVGIEAGTLLTSRHIGLCAAMNVPWLKVHRRPRIAILATGDEIVYPGDLIGANQIVSSNSHTLAAFVRALGGEQIDLGIARDTPESLAERARGAEGADLLVTTGGASEGDHDLVRSVLLGEGGSLDFWKIAMRPGKPLMFGHTGNRPLLGLPGNPVSSAVAAMLFLKPVLRRLQGLPAGDGPPPKARLGRAVKANDKRQDYQRATLAIGEDGLPVASPFANQDSSLTSVLAQAQCLVVRPPHAPAAQAGDWVDIVPFGTGSLAV
ncbi:MAG TPA: gephyrin-like molybdotransferase Glp [Azospirillaceae bacterium]|nr:gephyrin-like molybdotransferase Glp [Azospirillaceae bacterium]